ncbi:MAG: hypothetical protein WCK78_15320 [Paludibacter sp.]
MEKPINYNSMDLSSEKIFLYLSSGKRIPQNQFELDFLEQCEEIVKNGGAVIIPHED